MESLHRVSVGWFGLGLAALGLLGGCARPAAVAARPGELEMQVDSEASYAVVGRFHLVGAELGTRDHEIDFDAASSSVRLPLEPGAYVLTLHAGARLVCRGDDGTPRADTPEVERLVSSWPQRISIAPGELTTAKIGFGSAPALPSRGLGPSGDAAPVDPCANPVLEGSAQQALLAR
jgi:hypothetical protein